VVGAAIALRAPSVLGLARAVGSLKQMVEELPQLLPGDASVLAADAGTLLKAACAANAASKWADALAHGLSFLATARPILGARRGWWNVFGRPSVLVARKNEIFRAFM